MNAGAADPGPDGVRIGEGISPDGHGLDASLTGMGLAPSVRSLWMLLWAFSTALVVSLLVCQSAGAQVTCDDQFTGADSNAWGDPGNWSAGLPTSNANACWSGMTVVVSSGDQVARTISASGGGLVLSGGSLDVSDGTSEPLGSLSITGGSLAGGGFQVSGDLSWTGGTIATEVGGSATSTTDIGGSAPLTLAGAFGTDGSMTITNPNLTLQQPPAAASLASPSLSASGTLTFGPGVIVSSGNVDAQYSAGSIASNAGLTYGFSGLFQLVLNGGDTTTVAAGTTLDSGTEGEIELGSVSLNPETLDVDGTLNGQVSVPYPYEGEIVKGSGTINGDLTVSGENVVQPGDPIGTLTVTGEYVQSDGSLRIDIGGASVDTSYSQLVADQGVSFEAAPASGEFYGSATSLTVNPQDGFTPSVSDSFDAVASPAGVGYVGELVNFANPQLVPFAFGDEEEYGIFTSADSNTLTLKALPVIRPTADASNVPMITGASGGDGTPSTGGIAYVGDTLTCNPGTWDFDPTSFTYTWSDPQYASGQTQVVTAAQVGSTVDCNVTATNANGASSAVTSQFVRIAALPPAAGSTPTTTAPAVSIVGAGTVLVDGALLVGCPGACSSRIAGSPAVLTATPAAGWVFAGWSGICTGTGSCTIPGGATSGPATATFTLLPSVSVPANQPSKPVINKVTLNSASVTFRFAKPAGGTHLQCALVRHVTGKHVRQPKPVYSSCGVTKTYSHLHTGSYTLYLRSVLNGRKSTAIERTVTIA
jgi:hypothetical protein